MKKVISLMAVVAFVLSAAPALADVNSSKIKIETKRSGSIDNYTSAKAETGGNWAGGSDAGKGGSGGDVEVDGSGDNNNGGASAGEGGDGGDAGIGGTVLTGDANADAGTVNSLNTTDVDVDLYGEDMNSSELEIKTEYKDCECNNIDNTTKARARTGGNDADGSDAGKGGSGGDVEVEDGDSDNNNGGASAGDGGNGGESSDGGWVETGVATSNAGSVNILNATLVRVRL